MTDEIIKIIDIVVWPITTIILVFCFKGEFKTVLGSITKIKHKDTKINFSKGVKELSSKLDNEEVSENIESNSNVLAEISPRGSVIESWLKVEKSVVDFLSRHNQSIYTGSPRLDNVGLHMIKINVGTGVAEMLAKLKTLRNEAVHLQDQDIDVDTAKEYEKLAQRVIARIEEA